MNNKFKIINVLLLTMFFCIKSMDFQVSQPIVKEPKKARTKLRNKVDISKKIRSDLIKLYVRKKNLSIDNMAIENQENIERTFKKVKKHKCRYCKNGYTYISNNNINVERHEKLHMVKEGFPCECGCRFKHMGALKKHMRDSHKKINQLNSSKV